MLMPAELPENRQQYSKSPGFLHRKAITYCKFTGNGLKTGPETTYLMEYAGPADELVTVCPGDSFLLNHSLSMAERMKP